MDANKSISSGSVLQGRFPWSRLQITIAILVVITAFSLVLLPRINRSLGPITQDAVEQRARSIGFLTLERLVAADNFVRLIIADAYIHGSATDISKSTALDPFSNVAFLESGKTPIVIKGTEPILAPFEDETIDHIRSGQTALIAGHTSTTPRLTLVRAVGSRGLTPPALLLAELAPEYLWRSLNARSDNISVCILDGATAPVYCEPAVESNATVLAVQALESPGSEAGWRWPFSQQQLTATSQIEIAQRFGAPNWSIVVNQAGSTAIAPDYLVAIIYMAAGIAAVMLSAAMASVLLRRRTRSLAPGASSVVPSRTKGEKIKAANSANPVETPDRTAEALRVLSEIDRAILSGATFERIVNSVFLRVRTILPGDAAAIAFLDREQPAQCKMIIIGPGDKHQNCSVEDALDARSTSELALIPDGQWFDCNPDDALLAPLHGVGMGQCLMFPVFRDGIPSGALMIATRVERRLSKQEYSLARDIAHRLGVAFTSAARGQELLFHSLYDSTTELPNRKFFESRLEEEISRARRETTLLALLLVDLDNFKKVNDSYGHEGGDILLEQASERLKNCLRTEDLVARVGSDEFGVLLPTITQDRDATNVAEKLIETLSAPYTLGAEEHHLSATIGVAVFPQDGQTSRALLRSADFAMHAAKREGGAKFSAYEAQSNEQAQDQAALANDLRQSITKSELVLFFQPQIDLRRGEIVGAEALVRWQHRTRGLVMPGAFINIAEQSDFIEQVGRFVRREASTQFRVWESQGASPMRVTVNVSSREFKCVDFLEEIESTLVTSGLRPFSLELEITESLLMERSDHVLAVLKALSDRGVRIAIDDFGTGYSSMAYLKDLPFHVLKIDRSFVKDIGTANGSDSIVDAIIGMAQALGKEIVAEGIETDAQRTFLAENGCDIGQGFLWSRPVPADEFATFVRNWNETARRMASVT